ncbi:uncharacterized protein LOC109826160 isoform X2 [Asparagus officinalis]|uniref:uncharacterized protein LOC109826160 isoform X2 n=1 Tax=Asparagus officinalis TaxID=4686 RepID=UPI00098E6A12|nr:uncharacterized protein LOC109826160 isoform X2 [Asparagus officinalis]
MAVQAQYPSHILLFNNNNNSIEQERKEMECAQQPPGFFFSGVNGNPRKRGREFQMMPTPSIQSPAFMNLVQLQAQAPPPPPPSLVSTGLKLAFEDGDQFVEQDLLSLVNNQKEEIERYLVAQVPELTVMPSPPSSPPRSLGLFFCFVFF